jgi:hypothetical protein
VNKFFFGSTVYREIVKKKQASLVKVPMPHRHHRHQRHRPHSVHSNWECLPDYELSSFRMPMGVACSPQKVLQCQESLVPSPLAQLKMSQAMPYGGAFMPSYGGFGAY